MHQPLLLILSSSGGGSLGGGSSAAVLSVSPHRLTILGVYFHPPILIPYVTLPLPLEYSQTSCFCVLAYAGSRETPTFSSTTRDVTRCGKRTRLHAQASPPLSKSACRSGGSGSHTSPGAQPTTPLSPRSNLVPLLPAKISQSTSVPPNQPRKKKLNHPRITPESPPNHPLITPESPPNRSDYICTPESTPNKKKYP